MVQLQKDVAKIEKAGVQVVGVSYDSPAVLKRFADKRRITFPLLSDPDSKVIDAYGLRNTKVRKGSRQDGIPHPATILVDEKGVVRANLPGSIFRRHSTQDLLNAVEKLK